MVQLVRNARIRKIALVSAVAVGTGLPVVAVAQPASAATTFTAYHSVSGKTHQQKFNYLSKRGYRPISLAVAGSANPRYTAVWVKRRGPAFKAFHGYNAAKTQRYYDAARKQGYTPTVIAATGAGGKAVFAGFFEKKAGKSYSWANLTASKLASHNAWAAKHGYIPIAVDAYGSASAPRYLAVWGPNPRKVRWSVSLAKTAGAHHQLFKKKVKAGWRPSYVVHGIGLRITAIWRSDRIGPWIERTGMSSAGYQRNSNAFKKQGFRPIQVAGGGSGKSARYAAIWAK